MNTIKVVLVCPIKAKKTIQIMCYRNERDSWLNLK